MNNKQETTLSHLKPAYDLTSGFQVQPGHPTYWELRINNALSDVLMDIRNDAIDLEDKAEAEKVFRATLLAFCSSYVESTARETDDSQR